MMFQMCGGGFTMTTIKTMLFQIDERGFTMTTMQGFSRFINAFLIVRHEIQTLAPDDHNARGGKDNSN